MPARRQSEQSANLGEREAEFPRAPDESEPAHVVRTIPAIAPAALRRGHETDALVVADRLDVAVGPPREFADRDGCAIIRAFRKLPLESVAATDGIVWSVGLKELFECQMKGGVAS
jgi:hypothetical protein